MHNFLEYAPQYPEGWSSYYIQPICDAMQTIWANQVHFLLFHPPLQDNLCSKYTLTESHDCTSSQAVGECS